MSKMGNHYIRLAEAASLDNADDLAYERDRADRLEGELSAIHRACAGAARSLDGIDDAWSRRAVSDSLVRMLAEAAGAGNNGGSRR